MSASRRLLYALVLVLVALLSYTVVEAVTGPGPSGSREARPPRSRPQAGLATSSTPTTSAQEPDDSRRGAVVVAARYLEALDEASRSPATSRQLRALTLPPLTERALRVEAVSAALKQRLTKPGPAFIRGWRLGWRVVSFRPRLARIALWAMGTVQSSQEVLTPNYSTTFCAMRLTDGGWRVFAAATKPGPTPPVDGSDHPAIASFVREANQFQPFGDAP